MSTSQPSPNPDHLAAAAVPGSRVRLTVLTIAALHVVVIGGLLIQGCDKKGAQTSGTSTGASNIVGALPSLGDNRYFSSPPPDSSPASTASPAATGGAPSGTSSPQTAAGPQSTTDASPAPSANPPANPASASSSIPPLVPAHLPAAQNPPPDASPAARDASPAPATPATASSPAPAAAAPATNPGEHVVKKGDLVGELAKKYGVTTKALLDANPGVNPRNLKVDSKLVIPAPTPKAPAAAAKPSAPAPAAGAAADSPDVHIVKQGDTLAKIAKKYGITVNQLRTANRIKGDRIVPNQRLNIPSKAVPPSTPGTGDGPA